MNKQREKRYRLMFIINSVKKALDRPGEKLEMTRNFAEMLLLFASSELDSMGPLVGFLPDSDESDSDDSPQT